MLQGWGRSTSGGGAPMYISSRRSSDKMVHDDHCRYAKMIAPHNREEFSTAHEAYCSGKTACIHCAAIMQKLKAEMTDLLNICEANGISILFDYTDGTLEIVSKVDKWKLAPAESGSKMYLYHKNTARFCKEICPFEGYHYQRQWYRSIRKHLEYIVQHDWYKIEKARKQKIREQNERLYFHTAKDTVRSGRHISKIRTKKRHLTARERARYAAGM